MSDAALRQRAMDEADDALRAVKAFHIDDREQVREALRGLPVLALLALAEAALAEMARAREVTWDDAAGALTLALLEIGSRTEEDQ